MLQDDSRGMSRWLANRAGSISLVQEAVHSIAGPKVELERYYVWADSTVLSSPPEWMSDDYRVVYAYCEVSAIYVALGDMV